MSFSVEAGEILELHVQESIDVYHKPDGKRISQLDRGDRVVISPRIYGGFRKVLITYKGKKRGGYIAISDMEKSTIGPRGKRFINHYLYKNRKGFGLSGVVSYLSQESQEVDSAEGKTYEVGKLTAPGFHWAVRGQYPWGQEKAVEVSLALYSIKVGGEVHAKGQPLPMEEIDVAESGLLLGGLLKFYGGETFWYGPSLDLSLRQSIEFKIKGIDIGAKVEKSGLFVGVGGSLGWDIPLSDSIYFIPELKLGVGVNKKPFVMESHLILTFAWAL